MLVVDVQGLTIQYESATAVGNAAVDNVSFAINAGETVALVGANGAGKTSTIAALTGSLKPASGSISIFGADPTRNRASIARRWGVMPQTGGLPMGLKVAECVQLFADIYGNGALSEQALENCGLTGLADRRWRSLSGGEQQRVSLAVALVSGNELLILDEPTAALDVPGQQRVLQVIADRARQGGSVLLTTHRFEEVEKVADRVLVLHHGRLVADATLAELTEAVPEIRLRGVTKDQTEAINSAMSSRFVHDTDGSAVYRIDSFADPHQRLSQILNWCEENGVRTTAASVGSRSLADAYREMISE